MLDFTKLQEKLDSISRDGVYQYVIGKQFESGLSSSEYLEIDLKFNYEKWECRNGTTRAAYMNIDTITIRVSDHDLPASYRRGKGETIDVSIGQIRNCDICLKNADVDLDEYWADLQKYIELARDNILEEWGFI